MAISRYMCTAIGFKCKNNYYFGRTLDVCAEAGAKIVIAPRNFPLPFKVEKPLEKHYAIMGTALISGGLPLYYDAMNEKGLCMAGLNFPDNAVYHAPQKGKDNLASFELIPHILGRCANIAEAKAALESVNIADISFSEDMPYTPLHWLIGDKSGEIVVESVADGLKFYDNPAGVLTNNPPFEQQIFNLKNYAHLSPYNPANTFSERLDLTPYSRGMGGIGLPGDWSSPSRFVRAAFVKFNYPTDGKFTSDDFFNIIDTVKVPRGCVEGDNGFQYTVYSCCCNVKNSTYIRKTYNGVTDSAKLNDYDLDGTSVLFDTEQNF